MVTRILILVALVVAIAGCEKRSKLYCEKNPDDLAHCDPPPDAPPPMMCADNSSCTTQDRPFCQLDSHVCVECLSSDDCHEANALNCDPLSFTCKGCSKHSDCPSNVCLPSGACGDESQVVYLDADNGADSGDGTMNKPRKTWTKALDLVTDTRRYIKVSGITAASVIIDKSVVVLAAPGAKIIGSADPALKVQKFPIKIIDLEIACPSAPSIGGVKVEMMAQATLEHMYIHGCGKIGVEVMDRYVAIDRSNIESNAGGGIVTAANADYVITNTFIVHNGATNSMQGGVELGSASLTNRFEFNTVAHNQIAAGVLRAGGVMCPLAIDSLPIPNNLLVANTGGDGNLYGGCSATGSANETNEAPFAFVNPTTAPYDYHLTESSTAISASTTATVVSDDIDGQLRPQGPKNDLGADEYKP